MLKVCLSLGFRWGGAVAVGKVKAHGTNIQHPGQAFQNPTLPPHFTINQPGKSFSSLIEVFK